VVASRDAAFRGLLQIEELLETLLARELRRATGADARAVS
jgi:hypothetical protein